MSRGLQLNKWIAQLGYLLNFTSPYVILFKGCRKCLKYVDFSES